MDEKKKKDIVLNQEARDKIYREEMDKRKKRFVERLNRVFGDTGINLFIILSSGLFGVGVPVYIVGLNAGIFVKAFEISPLGVTGILSLVGITMFLGWFLFGVLSLEIYKRQKNKNKKGRKNKKWWEI